MFSRPWVHRVRVELRGQLLARVHAALDEPLRAVVPGLLLVLAVVDLAVGVPAVLHEEPVRLLVEVVVEREDVGDAVGLHPRDELVEVPRPRPLDVGPGVRLQHARVLEDAGAVSRAIKPACVVVKQEPPHFGSGLLPFRALHGAHMGW